MKRTDRSIPTRSLSPAALLPKEGLTLLNYLGGGNSIHNFYSSTGSRYQFGGKNHKVGYVLNSDVDALLKQFENGKPLFEIANIVKPEAPAPAPVTPTVDIPEVPAAPIQYVPVDEQTEQVEPKKKSAPKKKTVSKKKPAADA